MILPLAFSFFPYRNTPRLLHSVILKAKRCVNKYGQVDCTAVKQVLKMFLKSLFEFTVSNKVVSPTTESLNHHEMKIGTTEAKSWNHRNHFKRETKLQTSTP